MIVISTIMALWKARSLTPEQKVKLVEQEAEEKSLQSDESGALLDLDDVPMTEVYSSVVPVSVSNSLSMCVVHLCICKSFSKGG